MDLRERCLPHGWYPDSEKSCRNEIIEFSEYFNTVIFEADVMHGGVIPHAGWYFSGRLAALIFHLASKAIKPDVVAVFGGHLGGGKGIIYNDRAWNTPLGPIAVDQDLSKALMEGTGVKPEGQATNDNTVEIQMPLVKYFFPESKLLALRAPHSADAIEIGGKTAELAAKQGKSLLAFGSTDLTHYGPNYGFSPHGRGERAVNWVKETNDREFIDLTEKMDFEGLLKHAADHHSACSAGAVAAAGAASQAMGSKKGTLVDYYTSYDIMPGDSFVGYAGMVF